VHRSGYLPDSILRQHDHARAAGPEFLRQAADQGVNRGEVAADRSAGWALPLKVIIEMREVNEGERRPVQLENEFRAARYPL
jgi:hypothetical protein